MTNMTNKKLKEILNRVPDDAVVYCESDHGQQPERANGVLFCIDDCGYRKLPHYGEDLDWFEYQEIEDMNEVIAVLIMA